MAYNLKSPVAEKGVSRFHRLLGGRKKSKAVKTKKVRKGTLIVIGGREDKFGEKKILKEIAQHVKRSKLVLASVASDLPNEVWHEYRQIFHELGVKNIEHLTINSHQEALSREKVAVLDKAKCVFFTGGDQVKITSKIGGTPLINKINEIYKKGGVIAGTSAGAAIMGKIMLIGGENGESHKVGNWMMAPGLGFVDNIIVDQHFAQRGRIGRLLGAVALNPGVIGVGIDEDTSIIIKDGSFKVLGTNAVYVIDGRYVTATNVSEAEADNTMSMHDIRLHILAAGQGFNLNTREVIK
jgi:cyanophycinase